jgi:hypothetical protein
VSLDEEAFMSTRSTIGPVIHPALQRVERVRLENAQDRIADRITTFAGSMWFVYAHIAWFTAWIVFGVEHYPYGLLTMIVSLRGDLPVDVRDDQPEPCRPETSGAGRQPMGDGAD